MSDPERDSVFELVTVREIPLEDIPDDKLMALYRYWKARKQERAFALREELDPVDIPELLGSVRLVDIEDGGVFRFRLYGTSAANPDQVDMTGKTTRDYPTKEFGDLVTAHYAQVASDGVGRCWFIDSTVGGEKYTYFRIVLPISRSGTEVDALLVSSKRSEYPFEEPRFSRS